jgi:hypothetical protein
MFDRDDFLEPNAFFIWEGSFDWVTSGEEVVEIDLRGVVTGALLIEIPESCLDRTGVVLLLLRGK